MIQTFLSLVSRWLLPSSISVEKRLAAMRETNHDLERVLARRVYVRLRRRRHVDGGSSTADSVL